MDLCEGPLTPPERKDPGPRERTIQSPAVGKLFGNYEILEEINRGSFGVVYRARQIGLDRIVALKVLLAGAHASPDAVARFQREARAVARLKHPSIVPIYDIGTQDGHHYFAMEFVEGHSLSALVHQHAVTIPEALAVAEELADAMESAHRVGVIHRDIKPSNVLIDRAGHAHLTDFGLAKQVNLDTQYTQTGTTLGTPAYMPPEQARGEVQKIDARADVYALGAVLYEMLVGAPPFAGRSLLEVVIAVINEPVKPPRQKNPRIHRDIQTIVMKCLEKDLRNRYVSAAELRDDIRRFRSGEAIRAKPVGLAHRTGRYVLKHSFLLGSVSVVCLVVVLAVAFAKQAEQTALQDIANEKKKHQEERKEQEAHDILLTKPKWEPFWWTPDRPEDKLSDEERRKHRFQPNGSVIYEAFDKNLPLVLRPSEEEIHPLLPGRCRNSHNGKLIIGDLEARVRFKLNAVAAMSQVRIGIQSNDSGIPYLLQVGAGVMSLVAPVEMAGQANPTGIPGFLHVKAEKEGPVLTEGEYLITIRREGMHITFELLSPGATVPHTLKAWDLGLSHWKFKNTLITIRDVPLGLEVLDAKVLCRVSPQRTENITIALNLFYDGEYNRADFYLMNIVDNPDNRADEKDWLRIAQAAFHLALIQDINAQEAEFAASKAGRVLPPPQESEHNNRALDALNRCRPSKETQELRVLISLRRLARAVRQEHWSVVGELLDKLARLGVETESAAGGRGLGEPFAWELQPVLLALLRHKAPQAFEHALALNALLGIAPGSRALDQAGSEIALLLAGNKRKKELFALHKTRPTPAMLLAFSKLMRQDLAEDAFQEMFKTLAYVQKHFQGVLAESEVVKLAAEALKRTLPAKRLALATAVLKQVPNPELSAELRALLPSSAKDLEAEDFPELLELLKQGRRLGQSLPEGAPPLAETLMAEWVKGGRSAFALAFYGAARSEMRGEAPRLFAVAADALAQLKDPLSREQALQAIGVTLDQALQGDPAEWRQARLELADLRVDAADDMNADLMKQALADYLDLYNDPLLDADLNARVAVRLGTLSYFSRTPRMDVWNTLHERNDYPEEARLAGRFVLGKISMENLQERLMRTGGPLLFTEAEWDIIRAQGLWNSNQGAARQSLISACAKAESTRGWPYGLVKALGTRRAPPESK